MRVAIATLIWLLDLLIKFTLGFFVVLVAWLCCRVVADVTFGIGWATAGAVAGVCIVGFFDGCDLILVGWAKRMMGDDNA